MRSFSSDRADWDAALAREPLQVRPARHAAVLLENLDDHSRRLQAREACEIAPGFGMPGTSQYAAGLRHDREYVPGLPEVVGPGIRGDSGPDRAGAVVR